MDAQDDLTPQPGDIVLLRIKGLVGKLVWGMQALNGDYSKWTHVGVMMDEGILFEAQPGGAVMTDWRLYKGRPYDIVRHHQRAGVIGAGAHRYELLPLILTPDNRRDIVANARMKIGRGYNWTTYFYLASYRLGLKTRRMKTRVQNSKRLICSQAADEIYMDAGLHLFADGRMPYDVTPGDLADLA